MHLRLSLPHYGRRMISYGSKPLLRSDTATSIAGFQISRVGDIDVVSHLGIIRSGDSANINHFKMAPGCWGSPQNHDGDFGNCGRLLSSCHMAPSNLLWNLEISLDPTIQTRYCMFINGYLCGYQPSRNGALSMIRNSFCLHCSISFAEISAPRN